MKHCKFHRIPNGINHQLVQDFETVHSMFVVAVAVVAFTFNDFLICPRWIMGNKLQMWTVGTNLCRFSDRPVI